MVRVRVEIMLGLESGHLYWEGGRGIRVGG